MNEGYVSLNNIKMVICGPPAVGKTAFQDLLLGKPAPLKHNSTGIAARPIQAVQITANTEDENPRNEWKETDNDDLLRMLSEAIEKEGTTPSPEEESSTTSDTPSPAHEAASSQEDTTSIEPSPEDTTAPVPTAQASNDTTTSTPHQPTTKATTSLTTSEATTTSQSASEATTPQSASEATTDSEFDKSLQELLGQITNVEGSQSQKLLDATWIHLLDSGGQPQFTDLLPMFVRDNSLYIIVMKATESLHDKPAFFYSVDGKPVRASNDLTMTNLENIENSVRSVVAAAPRDKGSTNKPMFAILATHIDRLPSKFVKARLKKYDEKILERLDKFHDHFIFYEYKSNQLIFPVNNCCDKNRQGKSAEIRDRLMPQSDDEMSLRRKKKIPIRWYVFNLKMKEEVSEETHRMISLQSCYKIGDKWGMKEKEVNACLEYLDSMRLCTYYPKVLKKVVFTSPQFLINCLSKIVQQSFVGEAEGADESLIKNGVFKESLLQKLKLGLNSGMFCESDLLTLLQHFNVISPMEADDTNDYQYFMPILLPIEHLTEEQKDYLKEKNDPLQITFKDRIFPKVSFIFHCQFISPLLFTGFISNNGSVSITPRKGALFLY